MLKKRTKEQICAERFPDSKAIPKQCTLHHFKHKTTALCTFLQGPSFMKHEVQSIPLLCGCHLAFQSGLQAAVARFVQDGPQCCCFLVEGKGLLCQQKVYVFRFILSPAAFTTHY